MAIPTPVSFWNFDESSGNAADAVGSNTLTNVNTVTYVSGLINNAALMVRATPFVNSSYFSITDAAQTGLDITGNLSVSMWIKLTTALSGYANEALLTKYDYATPQQSYSIDIIPSGGNFSVRFITSSTGSNNDQMTVACGTAPSTGVWTHLAVVFTAASATTEVYVNAVSKGTATGSFTSIFNSTAPFQLSGFGVAGQDANFDGQMDATGIWNVVLSSTDVSDLYNGGAGLQYPFVSAVNSGFFMAAAR